MLESLALALAKTLATYLFKTYVLMQNNVKIEGAPIWYMQNVPSSVCVYDYKVGGIETVDMAKASLHDKMNAEISKILETVIYENYKDLKDPKEKAFVYKFKVDAEAPIFINGNIKINNLEYIKKHSTTFAQGCIDKQVLIDYQNKRINKIKYELTHMRADAAFDEMDKGPSEFK